MPPAAPELVAESDRCRCCVYVDRHHAGGVEGLVAEGAADIGGDFGKDGAGELVALGAALAAVDEFKRVVDGHRDQADDDDGESEGEDDFEEGERCTVGGRQ